MEKLCLFLLLAVCYVHSTSVDDDWEKYKLTYERHFDDPAEEQLRKQIYLGNKKKVEEHNDKYEAGLVSYMKSINKFSDRTEKELETMHNSFGTRKPSQADKVTIQATEE